MELELLIENVFIQAETSGHKDTFFILDSIENVPLSS